MKESCFVLLVCITALSFFSGCYSAFEKKQNNDILICENEYEICRKYELVEGKCNWEKIWWCIHR